MEPEQIDVVLQNLQNHLKSLDDDCAELIRNQAEANIQAQEKVAKVKNEIKTLITKIRAIQTKACQSEDLVNDMINGIFYIN
jgi:ElaB/YqjD/DUF883 family membrane-anchored ribosome-binding protein